MTKLKMIVNLPPNAPYGSREETHFIKLSSTTHRQLVYFARELNISLEEAIRCVLTGAIKQYNETGDGLND